MKLKDKLMFIPCFEVCLRGSVISVQLCNFCGIVTCVLSNSRQCTILLREEMSSYCCQQRCLCLYLLAALGVDRLGEPLCTRVETVVLTGSLTLTSPRRCKVHKIPEKNVELNSLA